MQIYVYSESVFSTLYFEIEHKWYIKAKILLKVNTKVKHYSKKH